DRARFIPSTIAIAFSNILIAVQMGVLIGMLSTVSLPIDISPADVWITFRNMPSCDMGRAISTRWVNRLQMTPGVLATEPYIQGYQNWHQEETGKNELIILVGCELHDQAIGPSASLTPQLRVLLTEPDTVVIDRRACGKLGVER